jgi:hypothetical protein
VPPRAAGLPRPHRTEAVIVACMQPYLFPYLAYWQLVAAVDHFVLLDDVHYINRGWINRNRILVGGHERWLTVPLRKSSQNREIRDIEVAAFPDWQPAMERTLAQAYARAPRRTEVGSLVEEIFAPRHSSLIALLEHALRVVAGQLGLNPVITRASESHPKGDLRAGARILDVCRRLGATTYLNLPGGRELYDREAFLREGIDLRFIQTEWDALALAGEPREHLLSILHLLMWNAPAVVTSALGRRSLVA